MGTSAYLLRKSAPASGEPLGLTKPRGKTLLSCRPRVSRARWSGQRDVCVFASQIRTGCGRQTWPAHAHGHSGLDPTFPRSPALDGAGNGTSAHLLRKSAPASGACRRLRLLATNASRLLYARTLAGSSPGTILKKARHRDGAVLVLLTGAGNGTRTRECQLGKLMPYHLAMPAYVGDSITRLSCSIQG